MNKSEKQDGRYRKKRSPESRLIWLLFLAGAALLAAGAWMLRPPPAPAELPSSSSSSIPETASSQTESSSQEESPALEAGHLYFSDLRTQYQSGNMTLTIPRLGVEGEPVQNGTEDENLSAGPGLFEYAQMPSENGGNVSIAGHRDIDGSIFYYVHNLSAGDYFYLNWEDRVYRYLYEKTYVVTPDDWGPIQAQGYSCLTLVSCDPIGTTRNRIIIVARQDMVADAGDGYDYKPWADGMEKPYAWEADAVSYDKLLGAVVDTP